MSGLKIVEAEDFGPGLWRSRCRRRLNVSISWRDIGEAETCQLNLGSIHELPNKMSFIMRAITMFLGYVYPAYECFKSIEKNRPDMEEQRFWCQYWVLIAVITFMERIADVLISWLPMYNEAKLAFIVYLWYPKTKGTQYIYSTFFRPFVAGYEPEIDRRLNELKAQARDMAFLLWQRISFFMQAKFFELLHYVASPQFRLQARPHYPQLQTTHLYQSSEASFEHEAPAPDPSPNSSPAYYSGAVIQEEAEETKYTFLNAGRPVSPEQQTTPAAQKTEREPASSIFKATRSRHRTTYVR